MPTIRAKASRILIPALLSVASFVVGVNAWLAFGAVNSLLKSEYWVEHTWHVIVQVERIVGSAKDAETGVRGYFVTGKESYLEPYLTAQKELPAELDQFESLTADNPAQQANLQQLRSTLQQRMGRLQLGLDTFRASGKDLKPVLSLGGTGQSPDGSASPGRGRHDRRRAAPSRRPHCRCPV